MIRLGLCCIFRDEPIKFGNTTATAIGKMIFAGGLVSGRIISLFADGQPSPILVVYIALELTLVPVAIWVFRLPE